MSAETKESAPSAQPLSESAKRRETPGFVAETETLHDWHALWYLNAHPAFAADYIARNAQDLLAHVIKTKVNVIDRNEGEEQQNDESNFIMIGPMYDASETSNADDFNGKNYRKHHPHHPPVPLKQSRFSPSERVNETHTVGVSPVKSSAELSTQRDIVKILQQTRTPLPRMLAALAIGRFAYDVVAVNDEDAMKSLLPKPAPQKIDHTQRLDAEVSTRQLKNRIGSVVDDCPEMPSFKLTSAPAFNKMLLLHPPAPETVFRPFDCVQTSTDIEMVEENLHEVIFSICRAIGQMIESEHTSMYVAREDSRGQIYLERRLTFGGMQEKVDIQARNTIASYAADKRCAIAVAEAHQATSIFPLGVGQRNWEVAQSVISVPIVVGDENRLIGVVEYYRSIHLPPFKAALLKDVVKIICASALAVLGTPAFDRDKRIDLLIGLHGPSLASTVEDFDDAVNKLLAMGKKIINAEKSYIYFLLPRESYELDEPDGARTYAVKTEHSKTATGVVHHYFTVSHKVFNYRLRGQGMASALREYTRESIANKYFDGALQQHQSTCMNFNADYFFERTSQYRERSSSALEDSSLESSPRRYSNLLRQSTQFDQSSSDSSRNSTALTRESAQTQSTRASGAATRVGSAGPTWERVSAVVGKSGGGGGGATGSGMESAELQHFDDSTSIIPNEKYIRNVIIMPIEYMDNSIGCTPCLLAILNKKHQPNGFNRFDEHVIRKFTYYCGVILSNSTMQYTNSLNRLYLQTTLDEEAFFLSPNLTEAAEFCALVEKRIKNHQSAISKRNAKKTNKSENPEHSGGSTSGRKFQLPFATARIFYKLFLSDEKRYSSPALARPQLFNFILATEKNCQSHTVHHNYQHAVESCQALYAFCKQLPSLWNLYTPIEQYALFFGMFCHTLDYLYDADHIERFHPRIVGLFTCPHDENDAGRELLQILSKAERNDFMLRTVNAEQRAQLLETIKRYESYTDLLHAPQVVRALEKEYIGGDLYYETGEPFIKELLTKLLFLVADLQWTCSAFPQHRQKIRDYVNLWMNKADHLKLYGLNIYNILNIATSEQTGAAPFNIKTADFDSVKAIAGDMANFLRTFALPCYQILARVFAEMQPWCEAVDANMCAWQLCVDRELDWRIVTLAQLSEYDMQTELRAKRALALQTATMRLDRTLDDDQDSAPFFDVKESEPVLIDAAVAEQPNALVAPAGIEKI